jgi:hypothetical protein
MCGTAGWAASRTSALALVTGAELVAEILLMAEPLLVLSERLNAAPPAYPDELDGRLARSADVIDGDLPLIPAVIEPLRSLSGPAVPAAPDPLAAALAEVVVRVLEVERLRPLRLATMPLPGAVDDVDGLLLRCAASNLGGSSPILPWCRKSSPPMTSSGWLGMRARSCALRSCNDMPHTQKSCDWPLTAVDVLVPLGPAVEKPLVVLLP